MTLDDATSQVVTSDRAQIILGAAIDSFAPSMLSLTVNSFDEIVFIFIVSQCPVITFFVFQISVVTLTQEVAVSMILMTLQPMEKETDKY